jgi:uncharacterized protein
VNAETIIAALGMQPLPIEGGYYAVRYRSDDELSGASLPPRYENARALAGTIYFLETPAQFSAIHVLPTDEIYYHHMGDPLEMLFLHPDGSGEIKLLGSNVLAGQEPQLVAPRSSYHGSRPLPGGEFGFSLVSTSMAPGFDESDPFFPSREELVKSYPDFESLIVSLSRTAPHNI